MTAKQAIVVTNQEHIDSLNELKASVRQLHANHQKTGQSGIVRVSVEFDGMSPLDWLMTQPRGERIYWSGRDYGIEVAAVGEVDVQYSHSATYLSDLHDNLISALSECEMGIRYYGGIRFDLENPSEKHWTSFGSYRFVLPRLELQKISNGTLLLCNLMFPQDDRRLDLILDQIDGLMIPSVHTEAQFEPIHQILRPNYQEWQGIVAQALETFQSTSLDKVVLAREVTAEMSQSIDPLWIIKRLLHLNSNCFHYLFEPNADEAFLGASPERLFRREGRSVESEAVAGTCQRGESDVDDARLIDALFRSAKEQREHEFVRISLQEEIAQLSTYVTMDTQPSIMRLASERHLVSRLRAIMNSGYTSLDVLEALHPSPAVGGYPSDQALEFIRMHEPFDRGWYAGPVGWLGVNEAEFAVGIRSALVSGSTIRLYSGAGIVRGSTPLNEWDEVGYKVGNLAEILHLKSLQPNPSQNSND